jgi:hypothetical protein
MGFDMWLPSIFDFSDRRQVETALASVKRDDVNPIKNIELMYDAFRATGGYYREGYNKRGLLTLMGMSWLEIMKRFEDPTVLPPAHARHLLAELEARPFTKAMLLGEERRPDCHIDMIETLMGRANQPPDPPPREADLSDQEIEEGYRRYAQRRQELMALLRAAVERNESLCVSG